MHWLFGSQTVSLSSSDAYEVVEQGCSWSFGDPLIHLVNEAHSITSPTFRTCGGRPHVRAGRVEILLREACTAKLRGAISSKTGSTWKMP